MAERSTNGRTAVISNGSQCGEVLLGVTGATTLQSSPHTSFINTVGATGCLWSTRLPHWGTKTAPEAGTEITLHFASENAESPSDIQRAKDAGEPKAEL